MTAATSINVAHSPWWFVDNRELPDDTMYWMNKGSVFILISDIRIGGTEMWEILTPLGVAYATRESLTTFARRERT